MGATYYPVAINTYTDENGATQRTYTQGNAAKVTCSIFNPDMDPLGVALLSTGSALFFPFSIVLSILLLPILLLFGSWNMGFLAPVLLSLKGIGLSEEYARRTEEGTGS